ncbi:MAG: DUF4321 domain-containing protein [Ruminococcus sp.]|nr:DUF4321 domain-containing protein [Ruminococcus sp.]
MNKVIYMSFLAISAIVLGGFLGGLVDGAAGLSFLSYAKTFAFNPGTVDLGIFSFTFGVSLSINISQILLIIIAIVVYYNTAPKLFTPKK